MLRRHAAALTLLKRDPGMPLGERLLLLSYVVAPTPLIRKFAENAA